MSEIILAASRAQARAKAIFTVVYLFSIGIAIGIAAVAFLGPK